MRTFLISLGVLGFVTGGLFLYASERTRDFDKVQLGASEASVLEIMGDPQKLNRPGFYDQSVDELSYYRWPIPTVYLIEMKDGKVVGKQVLHSP
ncbi:MAG: hypothetical protein NXI26_26450 [bacterium]|nr:hypothetical protein [bacterium]